ncbi:hypothetical protein F5X99DRAFT_412521 [Biscogniauxia marginata]|nr:hypothetical protein F5X99DRAFT_412521 [Biscogniauxia marginata]
MSVPLRYVNNSGNILHHAGRARFNPPNPVAGYNQSYQTWDAAAYSDRPLEIGSQGFVPISSIAFIEACEAIDVPIVKEFNAGSGVGVKQGTATLTPDYRRSSALEYYRQAVDRPKLVVMRNSPVQRITFIQDATEAPAADGVVYIDHNTSLHHMVSAKKEVILTIMASVIPEASTHQLMFNITNLQAMEAEYYAKGTGAYTAPGGITNGCQTHSEEELDLLGASAVVKADLTNRCTVEFLFEPLFYAGGPGPAYTPTDGNSTADSPIIDPNYYFYPADRLIAINAFHDVCKIFSSRPVQLTTGPDHGEVSPGTTVATEDDDAIFEYIKATTVPNWHAAGTCHMMPRSDGGVVDPRLCIWHHQTEDR